MPKITGRIVDLNSGDIRPVEPVAVIAVAPLEPKTPSPTKLTIIEDMKSQASVVVPPVVVAEKKPDRVTRASETTVPAVISLQQQIEAIDQALQDRGEYLGELIEKFDEKLKEKTGTLASLMNKLSQALFVTGGAFITAAAFIRFRWRE